MQPERATGTWPPAASPCGPTPAPDSRADRLYLEPRVEARHAPRRDLQNRRLPGAPRFLAADSTLRSSRPPRRLTPLRAFCKTSPIPSCRLDVCLVMMLRVSTGEARNRKSLANRQQRGKSAFSLRLSHPNVTSGNNRKRQNSDSRQPWLLQLEVR